MFESERKEKRRIVVSRLLEAPPYRGLLEAPAPPKPRERQVFGRPDELAHLRSKPEDRTGRA